MKSKFFAIVSGIAVAVIVTFSAWVSASDGLSASNSYERAGLINEWFTQIEVGAQSNIVNMQLQINEDLATKYFLVEYGNSVERISQHELDAFGEVRGVAGAEEHANIRKEIVMAELAVKKRTDIPVTIRSITLPKSTIYTVTSRARVIAVDADTGEHLWHTSVGNPRYQTMGVGASKNHVAVVNGSTVYCLTADEGRILWSRDCQRAPSAPPSVGEYNVYVPLVNGRLEVFSIPGKGRFSKSFLSFGPASSKPLLTSSTISWPTKEGYYAVAPYRARSIQFRLDTGNEFVGGGADGQGTIYVNTVGGTIIALDEKSGSVVWEYSTGDRITTTPFVREGTVYAISTENRLYGIDTDRGLPAKGWEKPVEGVSKYVGMSKDRLYVLDSVGNLMAMNPENGKRLARIDGRVVSFVLPNSDSDRLYIGTGKGAIRCLRETGNTYPIFHADLAETLADANQKATGAKVDATQEAAGGSDDPFNVDSDPFADDETDPFASDDGDQGSGTKEEDPFGSDDDSDEDPFGSSGDAEESDEDPFGGGSEDEDEDPFGGI